MSPRIKRIQNPTYSDAELSTLNPLLKRGEIVVIRDGSTLKAQNFKIGDGFSLYNDLELLNSSIYPYTDLVTNTIGDVTAGSSQYNRLLVDIVHDMISPFQVPAVSDVRTNAGGSSEVISQLEVGQTLSTAISVTYVVSNQANIGVNPVEVDSFGFFNESNPYPIGAISITPLAPLTPTQPIIYTINVRVEDTQNNFSAWISAFIRFDMRFIWGASTLADLTTSQHALDLITNGGGQAVKQQWQSDYEINVGGYGYVLIPSLLLNAIPPPVWTDISNPNAPASIGMVNVGTLSVNNGVAIYNYEKFRTPFNNLSGVKLKAS